MSDPLTPEGVAALHDAMGSGGGMDRHFATDSYCERVAVRLANAGWMLVRAATPDSLRLDPEDPESVERLRALSEAATPGPWAVGFADGSGSTYVAGPNEQPVVRGGSDSYGIPQGAWRPGDATLIVAAVNYVRSRLAHEWKASALPDRRSGLDRRHGPGADLPNVHERRSTHRRKGDWEAHIARASALPDPAPEAQASPDPSDPLDTEGLPA